jgi:hypothetical protein
MIVLKMIKERLVDIKRIGRIEDGDDNRKDIVKLILKNIVRRKNVSNENGNIMECNNNNLNDNTMMSERF